MSKVQDAGNAVAEEARKVREAALEPAQEARTLPAVRRTAEDLIALAVERGAGIETIERMMAVRRELNAEQAKAAFDVAMSEFQAGCPVIVKRKAVYNGEKKGGGIRYVYAPLDDIVRQVGPILSAHGLSHTEDAVVEASSVPDAMLSDAIMKGASEEQLRLLSIAYKGMHPSWVVAVCTVSHIAGHSETKTFRIPVDHESYMTAPQQFASALTFGKRYAFCNALGILTGDEDNDAQTAGAAPKSDLGQQLASRVFRKPEPVDAEPQTPANEPVDAGAEQAPNDDPDMVRVLEGETELKANNSTNGMKWQKSYAEAYAGIAADDQIGSRSAWFIVFKAYGWTKDPALRAELKAAFPELHGMSNPIPVDLGKRVRDWCVKKGLCK
jgi:hypothetical protein